MVGSNMTESWLNTAIKFSTPLASLFTLICSFLTLDFSHNICCAMLLICIHLDGFSITTPSAFYVFWARLCLQMTTCIYYMYFAWYLLLMFMYIVKLRFSSLLCVCVCVLIDYKYISLVVKVPIIYLNEYINLFNLVMLICYTSAVVEKCWLVLCWPTSFLPLCWNASL